MAWLNGFNVAGAGAVAGQLTSAVETGVPNTFNVSAKTSLTAEQLVAALNVSTGATASVHANLSDAQNNTSPVSGALSSTTYYVRVAATVGVTTVYNVFTINLTIA